MSMNLGALCTDFYVNQKISVTMDLPTARETVLDLCDRIRKQHPAMERFRRYNGELALESKEVDGQYNWMALQQTSVRSGWVNPGSVEQAYDLHRLILEIAPFFLSINAIEVE